MQTIPYVFLRGDQPIAKLGVHGQITENADGQGWETHNTVGECLTAFGVDLDPINWLSQLSAALGGFPQYDGVAAGVTSTDQPVNGAVVEEKPKRGRKGKGAIGAIVTAGATVVTAQATLPANPAILASPVLPAFVVQAQAQAPATAPAVANPLDDPAIRAWMEKNGQTVGALAPGLAQTPGPPVPAPVPRARIAYPAAGPFFRVIVTPYLQFLVSFLALQWLHAIATDDEVPALDAIRGRVVTSLLLRGNS